jgi:RNA polymerase sigma factor (sigma-70 family)
MTGRLFATVVRRAEVLAAPDPDDADLVRRFAAGGDEAAFAALVARHGPMVWGVCRNLLAAEADAEDAFQATFLALVRGAKQVRNPAAVGAWLHGVAVRVATKAKRTAARRRKREERAAVGERRDPPPPAADWHELQAAVHDAVGRLPARERVVFVLCGLEGVRQPDAAAQLGLKLNTVSGLLARARKRLLDGLAKRGLAPAAAAAALGTAPAAAAPQVLTDSVLSLIRSADAAAGVSAAVLELARGATEGSMSGKKLLAAAVVLAALGVGTGAAVLSGAGAQDTGSGDGSTGTGSADGGGPPARGAGGAPPPGGRGAGMAVPGYGAGMTGMMPGMPAGPGAAAAGQAWAYRFEDKPNSVATFAKLLADNGNAGWEYCGVVEFAGGGGAGGGGPGFGAAGGFPGGPAGGPGAGLGGPGGGETKVVFKRPKAAPAAGGMETGGMPGMGMMGPGAGMPGGPGGMPGRGGGTPGAGSVGPGAPRGGRGGPGGVGSPDSGGPTGAGTDRGPPAALSTVTVRNLDRPQAFADALKLLLSADEMKSITADESTNSVVIRVTPAAADKVQRLIDVLHPNPSSGGAGKQ